MTPLVEVERLCKSYPVAHNAFGLVTKRMAAVEDVSFSIPPGETFGLVGESGSGKSTVSELILRLRLPDAGRIRFAGEDITDLSQRRLRPLRRRMQIVLQDPFASLNPRMRVGEALEEPLVIHRIHANAADRQRRVRELLDLVGLPADAAGRLPHEFSGGQRQRIGIARAIATRPEFLVADEAVSALDVSIQAQILRLLKELKAEIGLTMLFVSHDLGVVRYMCDRVGVMHRGRLVETGPTRAVFADPAQDYTRRLLAALPSLRPRGVAA